MLFDKGFTIRVAEERCLNRRQNRVECDHCVKNCPAGAILILKGHVAIDKDICLSCGVCLSDCPTGVFYSNQWDETTVSNEVDKHGWKTTGFFCSEHTDPSANDRDIEKGAVRLPACLGSITRGAWFELGLKTEIELYVDECNGCPMSRAYSCLEYNVVTAAEWLEASGHKARINFVNQCKNDSSSKCREIVMAGLKLTSRRELFLSLIKHARRATRDVREDELPMQEKSLLPAWRKRFAEIYQDIAIEGAPPAFWPTIAVDEGCVNCGICAFFCPTGALGIDDEGGTAVHHFISGYCLDCRICEMICPVSSIHREREQVEEPFKTRTISMEPIIICTRCGDTTTENDRLLCHWCQQEDAIEEDLKITYRNIFLKIG